MRQKGCDFDEHGRSWGADEAQEEQWRLYKHAIDHNNDEQGSQNDVALENEMEAGVEDEAKSGNHEDPSEAKKNGADLGVEGYEESKGEPNGLEDNTKGRGEQ